MIRDNLKKIIELNNIQKKFGDHIVIENLNMEVYEGEIVALLGETGAGKSTVLSMLMGNLAADSGKVRVAGIDPAQEFSKLGGVIGVSFQTDRLLPWRTARENVELALILAKQMKKEEARPVAEEWLARVKLEGAFDKYPSELSGGMRQRVSLARALCVDPALVLLDESFSQLDPVTSRTLRQDFLEIAKTRHKTCVFVTHRIEEALDISDRVLVLSAPARVALELHVGEDIRDDTVKLKEMTEKIEKVIGGD